MNLNLNGLNVYNPLFHLDLMIIFTMKEIFLKCLISMFFPLLDIKKRNKRSYGKRKTGNFKRKHKTVLSLFDLNILLNSGRHQMLSKLASLSISSFRNLDDGANKFYERKHDLYEAALLTRCYTQYALRPYIDTEINHIRYFIKIPFINNGIEFIDLPSIF